MGTVQFLNLLYYFNLSGAFIPDQIYSCTGWTLLPKKNCFISFFIKIFIAIVKNAIAGPRISCMHINSQAGYLCQFSWGILKSTFSMKSLHIFFLTILTLSYSPKKLKSKLPDLLKQNLAKNCLDFLNHVDWYHFRCVVYFLLQSLIQL